ncbi:MAG: transcription elongation factor SPT6 [bacterium]|nr:MAG: transcription elongation factor SPT6 [bacterium]
MSNQPPNRQDPKLPPVEPTQPDRPIQNPLAQNPSHNQSHPQYGNPAGNVSYNPYQTNEIPTQPMPNYPQGAPQQPYQQPYQQYDANQQPYQQQPYQQSYQQPYTNQQPYQQYDPNQQQSYQQPYQQSYQQPYQEYDANQQPYQQSYQQPYQEYGANQQPYQQYGPNQQSYQQYDPNQQPTRQGIDLNQIKVNFEPTLAAPLCYLLFFVSGLYFLFTTEKQNRLVRFHAMQSIFFSASWFVIYVASHILYFAFSAFFAIVGLSIFLKLFVVFSNLAFLGLFGAWVMSMYRAYKGEHWKLPYIGDMAEKHIDSLTM